MDGRRVRPLPRPCRSSWCSTPSPRPSPPLPIATWWGITGSAVVYSRVTRRLGPMRPIGLRHVCGRVRALLSHLLRAAASLASVITRQWTATDACGNDERVGTQRINVADKLRPSMRCGVDSVLPASSTPAPRRGRVWPPRIHSSLLVRLRTRVCVCVLVWSASVACDLFSLGFPIPCSPFPPFPISFPNPISYSSFPLMVAVFPPLRWRQLRLNGSECTVELGS